VEKVILDTNILIEILKGDKRTIAKVESLKQELCISSITAMELFYGARNKAEVKKLEKFILLFTLLYPDETLSRKAMELVKQYAKSHSLDIPDSLIAATALTQNCELFTYNRKDFRYIEGLKLVEL
jgi:predicted nucleic acid-binding protein